MRRLDLEFFQQTTETVARELLGKVLVRRIGPDTLSGIIVETEAYVGAHDLACHASRGQTPRNQVMFEAGGVWYVYLVYGIHFMLNIVTESKDSPTAVLIRAIEPLTGIEDMKRSRRTDRVTHLTNGPGKLCQAMKIDTSLNATSAVSENSELYIEDQGIHISPRDIAKTKRIGIDYAGTWKDKLLRFYLKNNAFVSRKE